MRIGIGNDHAGPQLKRVISEYIQLLGHEVVNYGIDDNTSVDYPDYGRRVAKAIIDGEVDLGVLICGTGLGISIAANKVKGIRAACVSEATSARLAREHNRCQIVAFGARIVGEELAKDIVKAFLDATPLGGRHDLRVAKIEEDCGCCCG